MKRFLITTAFVAATALPTGAAFAQSSTDTTNPQALSPGVTSRGATPAPDQSQAPAANAPAPTAPAENAPAGNEPAATAANPPPSDAIIASEGSGDIRADKIIGMKVYNPDGSEVGKVKDVLFDPNGNVKGVVVNVGGVLGIGAKPVGLQWKEVDVQSSNGAMKVNYTKEQLEAAPRFETQDAAQQGATGTVQPAQPATPAAPSSAPAQQ
ncbi:MAG TPA: PRC-barrel domain-containing protein [Dongiaceae bacterium]|nr:PRC-barrel domain-containing protein [Dongiaceae bacterium]